MTPKILFPFTTNNIDKTYNITEYKRFGYIKDSIEFIDTSLGNCGSFMLGFDRTDIIETVSKQSLTIPFVSGEYLSTTDATLDLSERIYNLSNGFYSFYSTSGSDAIEGAIKVAKLYNKDNNKKIVLGISESYHGSTYLTSSVAGGSFMTYPLGRSELCRTIPRDDNGDQLLVNTVNTITQIGAENISCLVIESCSWLGGVTVYEDSFWTGLKKLCSDNDILLIVDDIAMCGGKTGKMLGFDFTPDIFTMGKALSSGYYPLSVCCINQKVYNKVKDSFWAHGFTYSFSLSGIYSTIKYLDILEQESIFQNYNSIYKTSKDLFTKLSGSVIKDFTNYGLYFNLKFYPVDNIDVVQKSFYKNGLNVGIQNYEWKGLRVIIPLTADKEYFDMLEFKLCNALGHYV